MLYVLDHMSCLFSAYKARKSRLQLQNAKNRPRTNFPTGEKLLLFDNNGVEALGVLDVHSLHVAVQLLLGTLLVVSASGNADAESVGNALYTVLPDLLVQRGVQTDISGALNHKISVSKSCSSWNVACPANPFFPSITILRAVGSRDNWKVEDLSYHSLGGEGLDLADSTGSALLEGNTM